MRSAPRLQRPHETRELGVPESSKVPRAFNLGNPDVCLVIARLTGTPIARLIVTPIALLTGTIIVLPGPKERPFHAE